jgi:hypothetical protein
MSGEIIPIGKYKGQDIEQVRMRDPQYLQWLMQQAWFREKFASTYQVVVNVFAPPSEDTPAHNAIQVRFLDAIIREAFWTIDDVFDEQELALLRYNFKQNNAYAPVAEQNPQLVTTIGTPRFEGVSDVQFNVIMTLGKEEHYRGLREYRLAIEIKPSMGDDYPAVLRQIKRQKEAARTAAFGTAEPAPTHWFLLLDEFGASSVTLDQVRAIFAGDNIRIVMLGDLIMHAHNMGA